MARQRLAGLALSLSLITAPAMTQEVVRVVIDKYRFEPQAVTIKPGTVVEWVNAEKRTSHSIVVDGEEESERLFPGDSYQHRFIQPGRVGYRCGPHPEMIGTIEVVP